MNKSVLVTEVVKQSSEVRRTVEFAMFSCGYAAVISVFHVKAVSQSVVIARDNDCVCVGPRGTNALAGDPE